MNTNEIPTPTIMLKNDAGFLEGCLLSSSGITVCVGPATCVALSTVVVVIVLFIGEGFSGLFSTGRFSIDKG